MSSQELYDVVVLLRNEAWRHHERSSEPTSVAYYEGRCEAFAAVLTELECRGLARAG